MKEEGRGGEDRRAVQPLSKSTGIYASLGLIVALVAGGWIWGIRWNAAEARDTAMAVKIEDVRDRQAKYIGQGGSLTEQIEDLEDELAALKLWLQRTHSTEEVPP